MRPTKTTLGFVKNLYAAVFFFKQEISIDDNNYIKVLPNGDFIIHCYACGPTGSNVYYFKNNNGGLLKWTQRRSYGGIGKKYNMYLNEE